MIHPLPNFRFILASTETSRANNLCRFPKTGTSTRIVQKTRKLNHSWISTEGTVFHAKDRPEKRRSESRLGAVFVSVVITLRLRKLKLLRRLAGFGWNPERRKGRAAFQKRCPAPGCLTWLWTIQNISFNPNWIWRAGSVVVMVPNELLLLIGFGGPKLV